MDGGRPSRRIVSVERSFEWSRMEGQLLTTAYECVVPFGRPADDTAGSERACRSRWSSNGTGLERQQQATGA
jgi:hypothetical protein